VWSRRLYVVLVVVRQRDGCARCLFHGLSV
jgi:hypothetical protein